LYYKPLLVGIAETVEIVEEAGGYCKGYVVDISKKEEVYKAADVIREEVGDVSTQRIYILNHQIINLILNKIFIKERDNIRQTFSN